MNATVASTSSCRLTKAYDKTEQFGYIFAQRYSIADAKLETLGNVALIEAIENSLK
ncbi:MAG: hypothetical protein QHC79_17580 [Pseudosphingobacterium sp.]|nr:hypothetical protein [Olivibacter sp. UJ_SKK_5.1]MDX3915359.1 hypothetical protein [Pseudosphingobacterium sp.]